MLGSGSAEPVSCGVRVPRADLGNGIFVESSLHHFREHTKGDADAPESRAATARAMYLGVHVRLQRKEEPPPKGSPRKKQKVE